MKPIQQCLLAPALGTVLFAGCATGPSFEKYSSTVPPVEEGEGRIWFYRPAVFVGAAVQPHVMLNNQPLGKAQPGCFFYADRPPGTYEVKCTTEWSDKCQIVLATNSTKYIRLNTMIGLFVGHIIPHEVEESKALKELEHCKLITADGVNKDVEAKK